MVLKVYNLYNWSGTLDLSVDNNHCRHKQGIYCIGYRAKVQMYVYSPAEGQCIFNWLI